MIQGQQPQEWDQWMINQLASNSISQQREQTQSASIQDIAA
jgi:hypothetical protein